VKQDWRRQGRGQRKIHLKAVTLIGPDAFAARVECEPLFVAGGNNSQHVVPGGGWTMLVQRDHERVQISPALFVERDAELIRIVSQCKRHELAEAIVVVGVSHVHPQGQLRLHLFLVC